MKAGKPAEKKQQTRARAAASAMDEILDCLDNISNVMVDLNIEVENLKNYKETT